MSKVLTVGKSKVRTIGKSKVRTIGKSKVLTVGSKVLTVGSNFQNAVEKGVSQLSRPEKVCTVPMLALTQPPSHTNFFSVQVGLFFEVDSHHSLLLALRSLRKRNQVGISAPLGLEI